MRSESSRALENAEIRLMRNEPVDIARRQTVGVERLVQHRRHVGHRMAKDLTPCHTQMTDRPGRRRPAINVKQIMMLAVRMNVIA
jgi:hypothetical protein